MDLFTARNNSPIKNTQLIKSHKSLLRIKKKSFTIQKHIQNKNKQLLKKDKLQTINIINQFCPTHKQQIITTGQVDNINFLRTILNKKRQIQSSQLQFAQPISWHQTVRSVTKDYDYYDTIVRDLIFQIKQKQSQKPTLPPQPIINRKYRQKRTNTSQEKYAKSDGFSKQKESVMKSTQLALKKSPKRQSMVFRMNDFVSDKIYERKITSFLQFIYRINFSNSLYVDLSLSNKQKTYKVKVGKGNNSSLIKALIKRRFWLQLDSQNPNFIWSQQTRHPFHKKQQNIGVKTNETENKQKKLTQKELRKKKKIKNGFDLYFEKILTKYDVQQCNHMFYKTNACSSIYQTAKPQFISNHLPNNYIIGSKKILFMLMAWYYQHIMKVNPQIYIPKSYHIKNTFKDQNWKRFQQENKDKKLYTWLVKPGQNTNRGKGIKVAQTSYVHKYIKKEVHRNGQDLTYIVQQYIYPFLYQGRKFDIRHYLLLTSVNGYIKAYWYNQGYLRTSSQHFDLQDVQNPYIHLTNDAIQKNSQNYGKYEPGNKISYSNFQRYLDNTYPHKKYNFQQQILKKMKEITTDVARAAFSFIDPERKAFNFELYGLDFLIDNKFKPYLIEINANPCLETSCPLLNRLIPILIQHTFRVGLDSMFPPPQHYPPNKRYNLSDRILQNLKYELIFDEKYQGQQYRQLINQSPVKFALDLNVQLLEADADIFDDEEENQQNQIELFQDSPTRTIQSPQKGQQETALKLVRSTSKNN